jgi:hypothetical protein
MTSLLMANTRPSNGTHDGFGFPAQANTVSAEKRLACTALDISNIRPLGGADCVRYI